MPEQLHSPEEYVQVSNLAHRLEAVLLLVVAAFLVARTVGRMRGPRERYALPALALIASLTLAGFLFLDHLHELGLWWRVTTRDLQQQQHLALGVLLGLGGITELIAVRRDGRWWRVGLPVAILLVGVLFLVHPQHGSGDPAERALLVHRVAGTALVVAGAAWAASVVRPAWVKPLLILAALGLMVSAVLFLTFQEPLGLPGAPAHGMHL